MFKVRIAHLLPLLAVTVVAVSFAASAVAAPSWVLPSTAVTGTSATTLNSDIAFDSKGNAISVFSYLVGGESRVQAAYRPFGGQWQAPETLSPAGGGAYLPMIAFDSSDNAIVAWHRYDGAIYRIQAASRPSNGAWQPAENVSLAAQPAFSPDVAFDSDGGAVVTYRGSNDGGISYGPRAAYHPAGGNWQAPEVLETSGSSAPLATDSNGKVTAIWAGSSDNRVKTAQRSNGSWQAATPISEAGQPAFSAHIAAGGNGTLFATWIRSDGAFNRAQASKYVPGEGWQIPTTLSEAGGHAGAPRVGASANETAVVAWYRLDPTGKMRVQASKRAPGEGFQANPDTLSEAGQDAYYPKVVVDTAGTATVVWQRYDGTNYRIQGSRRAAGGAWQATPETLSQSGQAAHSQDLAVDSAGNVLASWAQGSGAAYAIHAACYDAVGPVMSDLQVPTTGAAGSSLAFSVSAKDQCSSTSVSWNFGDGNTASGQSTTHSYTQAGTYTVSVTATDTVGNTTTQTKAVTITGGNVSGLGGTADNAGTASSQSIKLLGSKLNLKRRNLTGASLRCMSSCTVMIKAQVKRGSKLMKLSHRTLNLAAGMKAGLKFRLSAKQVKQLRHLLRGGKAKVAVIARTTGASSTQLSAHRTYSVKR